jgi:hypothetical protein
MPMNAVWHGHHPIPKRPTLEQRLQWHVEHQAECGCRAMPAQLQALVKASADKGASRSPKRAPAARSARPRST